ncbi:Na/Pi cotransporter family protein [Methylobacterium mesophilicum]
MTGTLLLLDLAGWVALLLWGIHMIRTGMQRAFGGDLRRVLSASLDHPLKAMLAGCGVTLLLQSSTATGLMATGFAADGLVALVPALAVMLGANVGTALIVKALSFDVAMVAPVLVLLGAVVFRRASGAKGKAIGRIAIGLGLVLLGLMRMVATLAPYGDAPGLRAILGIVAADSVITVLLAALFAWAAHSSVAVILLVAALAGQGMVPSETALALVLGANLGSTLNPMMATREPAGRRVALGNLLVRFAGCFVALPLLGRIGPAIEAMTEDPRVAVANFHLAFNAVLALAALPLLGPLARLLRRLLPEVEPVRGTMRGLSLIADHAEMPSMALGDASRHALRMADILESMLRDAVRQLRGDNLAAERMRAAEREIEGLGAELQRYLARLDADTLSEVEERRLASLISFTIQIGHAGDVMARNVATHIARRCKLGAASADSLDLAGLLDRLSVNLRNAASLLVTEDDRLARRLAAEKRAFRAMEEAHVVAHVAWLREEPARDDAAWAVGLDLLRDLKRINDHLVAAAAYPILRNSGELLDSRLRVSAPAAAMPRPPALTPPPAPIGGAL